MASGATGLACSMRTSSFLSGGGVALARQTELWTSDRFHDPKPDELQVRHFVREDPDQSYALYLNVLRPGKKIFPHNHTSWACVAAVVGQEHNTLHEIVEGGLRVGPAKLRKLEEIVVEPGRGIAMLPDDIHSVVVGGDHSVTLPVALAGIITGFQGNQYGEAAALTMVSLVPALAIGILIQRHLVRGLTLGAVQG